MTGVYIVIGLVLIFFLLSMIGPKDFAVKRTLNINRSRSDIYEYIKFLKNKNDWGPWVKKDSNIELNYSGTDGEVGFIIAWKGNKDVGEGEQEITRLVDNERLESHLRFIKPFKSESNAFVQLEEASANETSVTWGIEG